MPVNTCINSGEVKIGDSMYAIIRTGNRQFRAEVGRTLDVERLPNAVNDVVNITDVLLVGDGDGVAVRAGEDER